MASQVDLRQAAGCRGGAGEAAGSAGLAGAGDLGRGAGAALRVAGPSGGRGRGRALSLRRIRPSCCASENALLVALDQVQDPRNLGAVCRSAEAAGAAGLVIPERRSAAVTAGRLQGVGGGGRAPADRPRPQSRRLARRGEGGGLLDLGRRRRGEAGAVGRRPERPDRARPGWRGQGPAPPRRLGLRRARSPSRSGARSTRSTSRRPPRRCSSRPFGSA